MVKTTVKTCKIFKVVYWKILVFEIERLRSKQSNMFSKYCVLHRAVKH